MAWQPPSADAISKDIRKNFAAEMNGADPSIWPNNLYVAAKVIAQGMRAVYLRLLWVHKQSFLTQCDPDVVIQRAVDMGQSQQPATLSAGSVTATGDDGDFIEAGTRLFRTDQAAFDTAADAYISGTTVVIQVVAEQPGKAGNTPSGAMLTSETPIVGEFGNTVTFEVNDPGLAGGLDLENPESVRARLLDLRRNPPHGGSPGEFIRWAKLKQGVTRVFVQRATPAAGHVTIVFAMDDLYANGIAPSAEVSDMVSVLDVNAPGSAELHVFSPTPVPMDVTLTDLEPNNGATQDAVLAELQAVFRRSAQPGSSIQSFTFSKSWISGAIQNASGVSSHVLSLPTGDMTVGVDSSGTPEIAVLGNVIFPALT